MAKEAFRLVRLLPDGCAQDYDYLVSCEDGCYAFSTNPQDAKLFESWDDFVTAAVALWRSSGPVDIMFERVFSVTWRPVCNA